jgi:hypothetical protein
LDVVVVEVVLKNGPLHTGGIVVVVDIVVVVVVVAPDIEVWIISPCQP